MLSVGVRGAGSVRVASWRKAPVAPTELIVARLDSTASFPGHAVPPCVFDVAVNVAVKRPAGGGSGGLQEPF